MKTNLKIIIIGLVALFAGLGLGYLLFGNQSKPHAHDTVTAAPPTDEVWTCSMHPQIRQAESGDCAICGMDLIPLAENTSSDPLVLEMTEAAAKLAQIQTTVIGETTATQETVLRLSGKVQADERRASSQVVHLPGRIEKLYVSFTGESVQEGQRLADLYSPAMILAQRELLEAKRMAATHPELLAAARDKLRYWKFPEATIQTLENSGAIQETFSIFADAGGVVTKRHVAVGDHLMEGSPLFDLVNLNRVWVLFDAYEEDLRHLRLGNSIEFTTPALPKRTFTARVTFIDPVINPTTRVASVRVEVANPGGQLKPEMLVYGSLAKTSTADANVLSVPQSAVMWTGERSVVYVQLPDAAVPSYEYREVVLGDRLGNSYQVLEGLTVGEAVVTNGSFTIDAAAQLNNQASMMNQDVAIKQANDVQVLPDYTELSSTVFKEQLTALTRQYLIIKDALVLADEGAAQTAADVFLRQLANITATDFPAEAETYWMNQAFALREHATILAKSQGVDRQREQFYSLSQALINSVKAFGITADTFFVQYCPMAFDYEGADWLSDVDQIRNPYFGDQMLKCGVVKMAIEGDFRSSK
ncbi:MAG: efflux RND transporter periplasmic adaptor subunit [Bacteroidota bacterium]